MNWCLFNLFYGVSNHIGSFNDELSHFNKCFKQFTYSF